MILAGRLLGVHARMSFVGGRKGRPSCAAGLKRNAPKLYVLNSGVLRGKEGELELAASHHRPIHDYIFALITEILISWLRGGNGNGVGEWGRGRRIHSVAPPCVVRGRLHVKLHFLSFLPSFHVRLTGQSVGFGKGERMWWGGRGAQCVQVP